jgi:ABC-2 family transporter protein
LKTVLRLLFNDLKRDAKRPWTMLLFAALPLLLSLLIASVFGGAGRSATMPTIRVAVLDQDKDLLSRLLRSLPSQGDTANHLQLQFVETRGEGLRLLERDRASALLVLPTNLTANLLEGRTNALELYENPAQQVLPRVVRQGASLLALALSSVAEVLGDPLRNIRQMIRSNEFPAAAAVGEVASLSTHKLGNLRTYLFPPIIKFETVPAAEFQPYSTNRVTPPLPP